MLHIPCRHAVILEAQPKSPRISPVLQTRTQVARTKNTGILHSVQNDAHSGFCGSRVGAEPGFHFGQGGDGKEISWAKLLVLGSGDEEGLTERG